MTLAEVEAILGCPPGNYFAGPAAIRIDGLKTDIGGDVWIICNNEQTLEEHVVHSLDAHHHYTWVTCTGAVAVDCDAQQSVIFTSFCEIEPSGLLQRFQLWLLK